MENVLPTYQEFVKLEDETLKLLHDHFSKLQTFAHVAGLVKQFWGSKNPVIFRFEFYWDVNYKDKECRLFLGGDVSKKKGNNVSKRKDNSIISNMSYYMCITEGTHNPSKILRKFHFDYVTARPDQKRPHPRFHLQYCGGLTPAMGALGITDALIQPLEPHIEEPRIFFTPTTLCLLMNIAFYEFPCDDTEQIKKEGEWRNLVRENEKKVLEPFYTKCLQLVKKNNTIFFDEGYV